MTTTLRLDIDGSVAVLTLDRPEIRNALSDEAAITEIITAIDDAERDPAVTVLVMTGTDPAFSAGGNIKAMRDRAGMFGGPPAELIDSYRRTIHQIPCRLAATDLVTIAAVNGPAVGAGSHLALACDIRIASERATFTEAFVDLGLVAGDGGTWFLTRIVGRQRAAELSLTARTIDAGEALHIGLVLDTVAHEDLLPRTIALATDIAAKPPTAVRLTKRLLRQATRLDLDAFLELTAALQAAAHHTDEHREAIESRFRSS